MRKTAYVYCRISQDRSGEGLGVDRQEADCRELAARLGLEVTRLFIDNDVSAYGGKLRASYNEMLSLIQSGEVDAVICWDSDRLHRQPRELENYIDACRQGGATTYAVKTGEIDLSTAAGMAIARTLGAWARYESDHKSDRLKRAKQQAREQGKFHGGAIPYGWDIVDKMPVINPEQAKAVKMACDMVLAGQSIAAIIREFQSRGIKTARGGDKWNHASLREVILRPKIAGLREVDGDLVADPGYQAIVDEEVWLGVRAVLSDPSRRLSFDNRNKWLLSGIATCECGSTVKVGATRDHRGGRRAVYRCKIDGPGHVNRQAAQVEMVVNTRMQLLFSVMETSAPLASTAVDSTLAAEANGLRARMSEAAVMAADGLITMAQLGQMTERLRGKLSGIEVLMASHAIAASQTFDAQQAWDDGTLEQRRRWLRELVDIKLLRVGNTMGRNFDPDSVIVTLKG